MLDQVLLPCMQVISFNLGSMGFLTNHSYRNYEEDLMGVITGDQDLGHCSMDQEVKIKQFIAHMIYINIVVIIIHVCKLIKGLASQHSRGTVRWIRR